MSETAQPFAYEYHEVISLDEFPPGERLIIEIADLSIVLMNVGGKIFALSDCCSHEDEPLHAGDVIGNQIVCPIHGARFDLSTGKALSLPAVLPVPVYPVRLAGQQVEIGIPRGDQGS